MEKLKKLIKSRIFDFCVVVIYCLFIIFTFCHSIYKEHFFNTLTILLYLGMPFIFVLPEKFMKTRIPSLLLTLILTISAGYVLKLEFNSHTTFKSLTTLLFVLSGFAITWIGFLLAKQLTKEITPKKRFIISLLFSCFFSLAIILLFELFKFSSLTLLNINLYDETILDSITSKSLSDNPYQYVTIPNITHTVVFYGDNNHVLIEGGYLDLGYTGLFKEIFAHILGSVAYIFVILGCHLNWRKFKNLVSTEDRTSD